MYFICCCVVTNAGFFFLYFTNVINSCLTTSVPHDGCNVSSSYRIVKTATRITNNNNNNYFSLASSFFLTGKNGNSLYDELMASTAIFEVSLFTAMVANIAPYIFQSMGKHKIKIHSFNEFIQSNQNGPPTLRASSEALLKEIGRCKRKQETHLPLSLSIELLHFGLSVLERHIRHIRTLCIINNKKKSRFC